MSTRILPSATPHSVGDVGDVGATAVRNDHNSAQQWGVRCPPRVTCIADLIGNTPLLRLQQIERDCPGVELWAKCEFANPAGSVKDRAASGMIRSAVDRGDFRPGMRLLDSTSGNTGIAYSMVCAALGIPATIVMPENASEPRKQVIRAYGAELVFSDAMLGSDGAILLAQKMLRENPELYFYPNQYANAANPGAHANGTAQEIWQQTDGRITHFVAGIGTSGTICGTSRRLHAYSPAIRCVAMQPDDAMHGLEGLKHLPTSIVPAIYDESVIDETIWLPTEEGWDMSERLGHEEGLHVGHSSGGNVAAALRIGKALAQRGESGVVVTILCDRGDRYFIPLRWERYYKW